MSWSQPANVVAFNAFRTIEKLLPPESFWLIIEGRRVPLERPDERDRAAFKIYKNNVIEIAKRMQADHELERLHIRDRRAIENNIEKWDQAKSKSQYSAQGAVPAVFYLLSQPPVSGKVVMASTFWPSHPGPNLRVNPALVTRKSGLVFT